MKQLVLNALVAMEAIGLNLYRKSVNADLVTLWARALTLREVNPEFIAPAVDFFMAHAKDFPNLPSSRRSAWSSKETLVQHSK